MMGLIMSAHWAELTVRDYVCSTCWGSLRVEPQNETPNVVVCCSTCEQTRGFVSEYYVNERRTQDHFDAYDVTILLQNLGIIETSPSRGEDQILEELGF